MVEWLGACKRREARTTEQPTCWRLRRPTPGCRGAEAPTAPAWLPGFVGGRCHSLRTTTAVAVPSESEEPDPCKRQTSALPSYLRTPKVRFSPLILRRPPVGLAWLLAPGGFRMPGARSAEGGPPQAGLLKSS